MKTKLSDQIGADWGALQASAPVPGGSPVDYQGTRWKGASRSLRSLVNWVTRQGSATSDLPAYERKTLIDRSRDAYRNHPVARAALTRCRTNIVGTGLMCRPSVDADMLGLSEDAAEALNQQIRSHFEPWAENPIECDIEMTSDFYGLQGLAQISAMLSGDVFANTPYEVRPAGVYGLKVQLIEADRISNPSDAEDTDQIKDGVKYRGAEPVGYYVRSQHPGDTNQLAAAVWDYFDAIGSETGRRRFLHVWNDKDRPGAVRGYPYLAPILEPLKQLDRYSAAEIAAAVVSAMPTIFITKLAEKIADNGNEVGAFDDGTNSSSESASPVEGMPPAPIAMGNGAIVDLAAGEDMKFADPTRPNANFDPFFMAMLKQIGAALELPVDELMLHYQSSYSAARAAMLQAWRFYTLRRWSLTTQFCQPIYCLWMDEEVAAGRLNLPGYGDPMKRRAYSRALWIGPARGSMDELKEAKAAEARINAGVSNESIETASMTGEDWSTVNNGRAREIKRKKENGTWVDPNPVARTEAVKVDENGNEVTS